MSGTIAPVTAVITGSFLSGAMMSLTFITVPVFFDTTVDEVLLVSQWRRMYHYGHQIMPVLAIGTFALYAFTCIKYHAAKRPYGIFAAAAAATVIMIPFTWFIMASTNNRLFQLEAASKMRSPMVEVTGVAELLVTWNWLHFTRSLLPLSGAVLGTLGTF
ncbi:hypothetical protein H634G_04058 [Metarhizium anisopliae BRIP 53293]|uniref:DUF1772 domain-containing protein n=1 Tax=Metarhizium anisopliae BRIP 53293 TaxID=1291518 RepID=A0A0D9P0N5_METAN|nr:hypothetical protein H634G_04058 [Metarhizium anisopliae BRIP 53293]KJK95823.1 hypothetical protein H633G_00172 [Metarhizium anisopliae BRIP 53284]